MLFFLYAPTRKNTQQGINIEYTTNCMQGEKYIIPTMDKYTYRNAWQRPTQ